MLGPLRLYESYQFVQMSVQTLNVPPIAGGKTASATKTAADRRSYRCIAGGEARRHYRYVTSGTGPPALYRSPTLLSPEPSGQGPSAPAWARLEPSSFAYPNNYARTKRSGWLQKPTNMFRR